MARQNIVKGCRLDVLGSGHTQGCRLDVLGSGHARLVTIPEGDDEDLVLSFFLHLSLSSSSFPSPPNDCDVARVGDGEVSVFLLFFPTSPTIVMSQELATGRALSLFLSFFVFPSFAPGKRVWRPSMWDSQRFMAVRDADVW